MATLNWTRTDEGTYVALGTGHREYEMRGRLERTEIIVDLYLHGMRLVSGCIGFDEAADFASQNEKG